MILSITKVLLTAVEAKNVASVVRYKPHKENKTKLQIMHKRIIVLTCLHDLRALRE